MYATGIGLVIYGLEAEELAAKKAATQVEPEAPQVKEEEAEPIEQVSEKRKKKEKPARPKNNKDARDIGKAVTNWLTNIFTEEDLGD